MTPLGRYVVETVVTLLLISGLAILVLYAARRSGVGRSLGPVTLAGRLVLDPRRAGQERLYSRRDRARLKYVLMGKCVGFSLDDVREMLDLYDLGDGQVTQLNVALARFRERIVGLERQKLEIDRAIAELTRASETVESMLAARSHPNP